MATQIKTLGSWEEAPCISWRSPKLVVCCDHEAELGLALASKAPRLPPCCLALRSQLLDAVAFAGLQACVASKPAT